LAMGGLARTSLAVLVPSKCRFAPIDVFLSLPREVTTTFDLRSHRVAHHVSIEGQVRLAGLVPRQ
jgi:hypothetical protein